MFSEQGKSDEDQANSGETPEEVKTKPAKVKGSSRFKPGNAFARMPAKRGRPAINVVPQSDDVLRLLWRRMQNPDKHLHALVSACGLMIDALEKRKVVQLDTLSDDQLQAIADGKAA